MHKYIAAIVAISIVFFTLAVHAKTREGIKVEYSTLWSAAVRLIRVDKNFEIIDKDKETGYILFRYQGLNIKPCRSSIEIMADKGKREKEERFIIQVSVPGASSIEERMLISDLKKKLREES